MTKKEEILRVLAPTLRPLLNGFTSDLEGLEEIRLRVGQPLAVTSKGESLFVSDGQNHAHPVTLEEIKETMNLLSNYSRYAFEDKIRQGFLTIQGGHRVGLAGRVILEHGKPQGTGSLQGTERPQGTVKTIAPVTFLNIRIARQVIGCGEQVLPLLWRKGDRGWCQIYDTLLVSPPGMGKTTLLRDLIRLLSQGGMTVGVVDERSELAACWQGVPQNQLGPRTDVLDGCPKVEGLMMLVRAMGPQVIAVDEIGAEEDRHALEYAMHCGCGILATAHGSNWEEMQRRPGWRHWMEEERFGRYVFLEKAAGNGYCYRVCDSRGDMVGMVWGDIVRG